MGSTRQISSKISPRLALGSVLWEGVDIKIDADDGQSIEKSCQAGRDGKTKQGN